MSLAFQDLRTQLLDYKHAQPIHRQIIVDKAIQNITSLPLNVTHAEQAANTYKTMAYTATLINYAHALQRIENQDYFEILIDFRMPNMLDKPQFTKLKNYFEFHTTRSQMRLKKPLNDIPISIWELFRQAQKIQLKINGLTDKFNLDELNIANPPEEQLYPIPIQMMAKYLNESVDRISASKEGRYCFAKRFNFYFLPGGGMVEIDLKNDRKTLIQKLLDEHLEEEHGNLWLKAAHLYNQLETKHVLTIIKECITKTTTIECMLEHTELNKYLHEALAPHKSNAEILADVIHQLDHLDVTKTFEQKKLLSELRATIQVEPFKLTPLYQEAIQHIETHATLMKIEQFGDTRACGGRQISNSFLMNGERLETWFSQKFDGAKGEFADDLTGSETEELTLLEAIANFKYIRFSHLLIALANELHCINKNFWDFKKIWNKEQYSRAKHALTIANIV